MKITKGQTAPIFKTKDIWGNEFDLTANASQKTLLMFFRYAECPLCNLRLSEIQRSIDLFSKNEIRLVAVFQSPATSLLTQIVSRHTFEFIILGDPERILYDLYDVKPSWTKAFKFFTVNGIQHFLAAWKLNYKPGKVEGKLHQIPADFLIDENNRLQIAHYGSSVVDHLPLTIIFDSL